VVLAVGFCCSSVNFNRDYFSVFDKLFTHQDSGVTD
jgi:hypothetical protein